MEYNEYSVLSSSLDSDTDLGVYKATEMNCTEPTWNFRLFCTVPLGATQLNQTALATPQFSSVQFISFALYDTRTRLDDCAYIDTVCCESARHSATLATQQQQQRFQLLNAPRGIQAQIHAERQQQIVHAASSERCRLQTRSLRTEHRAQLHRCDRSIQCHNNDDDDDDDVKVDHYGSSCSFSSRWRHRGCGRLIDDVIGDASASERWIKSIKRCVSSICEACWLGFVRPPSATLRIKSTRWPALKRRFALTTSKSPRSVSVSVYCLSLSVCLSKVWPPDVIEACVRYMQLWDRACGTYRTPYFCHLTAKRCPRESDSSKSLTSFITLFSTANKLEIYLVKN